MSRRVKNYWDFLNEGNALTQSKAAKTITTVIDPNLRRNLKRKSQGEIEQSKSKDGQVWKADTRYTYSPDDEGYVGWSKFHFGKVVLREIEEEGSTENVYEVLTGPNKGLRGNYEWQPGNIGIPTYNPPYGKKWEDLLGPDEEFFNNYAFGGGGVPITDIGGIEIVKVGNKGECEIRYSDIHQLYGKVRIYYDPSSYDSFSYEVLEGPNKGTKSQGFDIQKPEEGKGIYNPFSKGLFISDVIDFPLPSSSNTDPSSTADRILSRSRASSSDYGKVTGYNQRIFLDTTKLESINPPTDKEFTEKYKNTDFSYGMKKDYKKSSKYDVDVDWETFSDYLPCVGRIKKSQMTSSENVPVNYGNGSISLDKFPKISSSINYLYLSYYKGNPILLYEVKCKKQDSPSLNWNQDTGTYGNNFFVGMIYNEETKQFEEVKGEWYYDYGTDTVGIIYAYNSKGKKLEVIINLEKNIPNPKSGPGRYDKYLEKPYPEFKQGNVKGKGSTPEKGDAGDYFMF